MAVYFGGFHSIRSSMSISVPCCAVLVCNALRVTSCFGSSSLQIIESRIRFIKFDGASHLNNDNKGCLVN